MIFVFCAAVSAVIVSGCCLDGHFGLAFALGALPPTILVGCLLHAHRARARVYDALSMLSREPRMELDAERCLVHCPFHQPASHGAWRALQEAYGDGEDVSKEELLTWAAAMVRRAEP